jgi:hypothetical protein
MSISYSNSQAVISAPGVYIIDRDLTQPDPNLPSIVVSDGVPYAKIILRTRVEGTGGVGSTNAAIRANGCAALSIIGEGGEIRGFCYGVSLYDCFMPRIENLFIRDALFRGIKIEGNDAYVAKNDIRNVFGATWTPNAYCMGIEVQGMGPASQGKQKILHNSVFNVQGTGTGESVGISVSDMGLFATVSGNIVKNQVKPTGSSFGLWGGGDSDAIATHNYFDSWKVGAHGCTYFDDTNVTRNCTTRYEP